jgi:hypothetical protein
VESAPTLERAFAARRVQTDIAGDWNEVQVELGLKSHREIAQELDFIDFKDLMPRSTQTQISSSSRQGFGDAANPPKKGKKKKKNS